MEKTIAAPLNTDLPPIPAKQYFTISEVSDLCDVKSHVLRYWEQEFPMLQPAKRRGNRRYYQNDDILLIRKIRDLLYSQGFTISGARAKLLADAEAKPADAVVELSQQQPETTFDIHDHIQALESVVEILS